MTVLEDRIARMNDLGSVGAMAHRAGWVDIDPYKRLVDNIDSGSEVDLLELESHVAGYIADQASILAAGDAKENRVEIARLAKSICEKVIYLLGGWTLELNMPQNDVDTMIMNHQPLYEALQAGRATKSHGIISNMNPDAQISQEMIDDILEEFAPLGL